MKNEKKTKKVAVIGLGYVGLPLALRTAEKGYEVYGLDLDEKKVETIKSGKSPFKEEFIEKRKKMLSKINASTDPSVIKKADIVIVCVPTPVDEKFYPIFEPLVSAIEMIIKNRKAKQLIVVESTINPGVCEEVLMPLFEKAKLVDGKDYFIAHCPERINPGKDAISKGFNVSNIARVV
ncbi:MAG: NAD(P)-binding domain-containing protein, partial [Candidatus Moraniibacteriota bacterium]